jgi:hypothetical protein
LYIFSGGQAAALLGTDQLLLQSREQQLHILIFSINFILS